MIRITTGSRLHFGLFAVPGAVVGAEQQRQFGGVGMMVEEPLLSIALRPVSEWSAFGPLASRALSIAQQWHDSASRPDAFHLETRGAAEHLGLGTGTQLALAVGLALSIAAGQENADILNLARRLGRGRRSALGIHGFQSGGFLVEGGKGPHTAIAPLVARVTFPESWRVVLILPADSQGLHSQREIDAFTHLAQQPPASCDALCRLTLLGMLPAIIEQDLDTFGASLYEFNRRVGEMFRPVQGGIYAHPRTEELVAYVRGHGIHGTGQSSWGPAVFAVTSADQAQPLAERVRERFGLQENEVIVTRARSQGATIA